MAWQVPQNVIASEQALGKGIDRLKAALADPAKTPFASLGEVLDWLYRLDQWHAGRNGLGSRYWPVRSARRAGRTLGALTWVRGLGVHNLVENAAEADLYPSETLTPSEDLYPGLTWRWRPLADLPPSSQQPHDRDVWYREQVEQQAVIPPVDAATEFLLVEMHQQYP